MTNYSEKTLQQLDEIVNTLKNGKVVDVKAYEQGLFEILEINQWIEISRNEQEEAVSISKSNKFNALFLGGLPSQTKIK